MISRISEFVARPRTVLPRRTVLVTIALIHDDLQTTMPPSPTWGAGRAHRAIELDVVLRAIEAVEVAGDRILRMHHVMQPGVIAVFAPARTS